jgi:hypothetical protein
MGAVAITATAQYAKLAKLAYAQCAFYVQAGRISVAHTYALQGKAYVQTACTYLHK